MNIFAKVIYTTNNDIEKKLVEFFNLTKVKTGEVNIYSKLENDFNIVLINEENIKKGFDYLLKNYEIINFIGVGFSLPLDTLELNFGDIIIPNTFINQKNEVVFLESITTSNYDLNSFGLILNGICISIETEFKNESDFEKLKDFQAQIYDKESFEIAKTLKENNLDKSSLIIKIVGKDLSFIDNVKIILDLMI
ncbi:hypothetical protein H3C61_03840 [Candidatus Gracilibacteria bacterium]|nr:hypothetical protein [Candidatus Gracilibacteria bacterium]